MLPYADVCWRVQANITATFAILFGANCCRSTAISCRQEPRAKSQAALGKRCRAATELQQELKQSCKKCTGTALPSLPQRRRLLQQLQQSCNRAATELIKRCDRAATALQQSCNRAATELIQRCNSTAISCRPQRLSTHTTADVCCRMLPYAAVC